MTCPNCSKEVNRFDDKCVYCGYPLAGDARAQKKFLQSHDPVMAVTSVVNRKLLAAKVILMVIGSFSILGGLISYADTTMLLAGIIFGLILIALGLLVRFSPMIITTSLVFLFIAMYAIQSVAKPEQAAKGMYSKVIVLTLLIAAMITVSDIRKYTSGK